MSSVETMSCTLSVLRVCVCVAPPLPPLTHSTHRRHEQRGDDELHLERVLHVGDGLGRRDVGGQERRQDAHNDAGRAAQEQTAAVARPSAQTSSPGLAWPHALEADQGAPCQQAGPRAAELQRRAHWLAGLGAPGQAHPPSSAHANPAAVVVRIMARPFAQRWHRALVNAPAGSPVVNAGVACTRWQAACRHVDAASAPAGQRAPRRGPLAKAFTCDLWRVRLAAHYEPLGQCEQRRRVPNRPTP